MYEDQESLLKQIVVVVAVGGDRVGDDGCRLQVGDRITIRHAMMHPEARTMPEARSRA